MTDNKEMSIPDLLRYFWWNKLLIIGFTIFFSVVSISYALLTTEIYESEVLIAPADNQDNALSGIANSQLGGLAAMAGFNLGSASAVSKIDLAFAILQSKDFISRFIMKYDLKPEIMAAEGWDKNNNKILYDDSVYNSETKEWLIVDEQSVEPSLQKATKKLLEKITVNPAETNGFFKINLEAISPNIAQEWLKNLIIELNEAVRQSEQKEASQAIKFLEEKLAIVTSSEITAVIYQLIEEQTKRLMFTEVREQFAIKVIDPAFVPEQRSHPKRGLIVIIGTILGGLLGLLVVMVRYFYSRVND
ncbi:MAG: LPS O-antigen length regulator [Alcanivorax sp.]|nr:MAG: LPS O-antigen length regulator [Alcanivorax sp.]